MTTTLQVDQVSGGYGARRVIHDASLSVSSGEVVALIGPNGSGKSTLLKLASGQVKPTGGEILLNARRLDSLTGRERARLLAILPQSPPRVEGLTVAELVAHGRQAHRRLFSTATAGDDAAVEDALTWTGLAGMRERLIDTLSGGERQRAWIAMTVAQQSALVFLDEPTTFLDLGHQLELLELVQRLRDDRGLGVLIVLHDIVQAAANADRIVVVHGGRIVAHGVPAEVVTPEMLASVFSIECEVTVSSDGRVRVTPLRALRLASVSEV